MLAKITGRHDKTKASRKLYITLHLMMSQYNILMKVRVLTKHKMFLTASVEDSVQEHYVTHNSSHVKKTTTCISLFAWNES